MADELEQIKAENRRHLEAALDEHVKRAEAVAELQAVEEKLNASIAETIVSRRERDRLREALGRIARLVDENNRVEATWAARLFLYGTETPGPDDVPTRSALNTGTDDD